VSRTRGQPQAQHRFDPRAVLVAGLIAVCLSAVAMFAGGFAELERATVSWRFGLRHEPRPNDIVVVAIDDRTFSDLGIQWPFPRSLHARAVDRLRVAGAREIVYDVQFTEPTRPSEDLALYRAIERAGGAVLATTEADELGRTNVLGGDGNLARIHARAAASNLSDDPGGLASRFPYRVGRLETLAIATAERVTGRPVPAAGFDSRGALIDYRGGPQTFRTVSFSDLVAGHVDPGVLRGKIVVVGASAPSLQDLHPTPTTGELLMAGPEVQANAIWTVLHGVPLRDASPLLGLLAILALGMAAPLARVWTRAVRAALVAPVLGAAYAVAAQLAFEAGWILPVTYPLASLALGTVGMLAASHAAETRERGRVALENELLERLVRERTQEVRDTQLELIHRLGQAAESRDEDTGAHIERISRLAYRLGLAAGMSEDEAELLRHASPMHDIGKIGIPDRILLKEGRLDPDEWEVMKTHAQIGSDVLRGSNSPLVRMAEAIARTHHERWDGSGYPVGLAGQRIPLVGRIVAVCDVFDALTSKRPYKEAWPVEEALATIAAERGKHFDPQLADIFLALVPELRAELPEIFGDGTLDVPAPHGPLVVHRVADAARMAE